MKNYFIGFGVLALITTSNAFAMREVKVNYYLPQGVSTHLITESGIDIDGLVVKASCETSADPGYTVCTGTRIDTVTENGIYILTNISVTADRIGKYEVIISGTPYDKGTIIIENGTHTLKY